MSQSRFSLSRAWRGIDQTLLFTFFALIAIGVILSFAAGPAAAERRGIADPFYYLYRHGAFSVLSAIIVLVLATFSVRDVRRLAGLGLLCSLGVMLAIPFIGYEVNGAARWIRFGGFSLQPSEFLKPSFIVIAAWLFAEESRGEPVPGRLIALGIFLFSVALLILQPDFGQTVLLGAIFGAMLFAAGLSMMWTVGLGVVAGAGAFAAYVFLPHVAARIEGFLNPEQGAQTEFALEAISRGGLIGVGPGEGEIKRILPEANTDFVFSVAAEEYGLIASLAIIGLYAILFARAWMNAMKLNDHFVQLATAGLALQFGLQALINIGVNLNIIPPKGMTLPFVSYGGSSMLALAYGAGLLLALTRRRPGAYSMNV
ncbi:FtsW/RodA/SpoVE family cell cycle protein [Woodsholea maritima]|uniref:FtsW/RodA/SpoVE family cell cycle protein n=1 Tax=Woodsholea maritima TaxID=240237 RepID=UPI00036D7408|nr:putative peptidoglycan glycosyltransferase FtsW [Woodsholea maritima]